MKESVIRAVVVAALSFFVAPSFASAQLPAVFEYEGYLASDGAAVSGSYAMRFALYDSATSESALVTEERSDDGSRSCSSDPICLVDVYAGRFRVLIGRYEDISDIFDDGDQIYVGVTVRDNTGTWIPLSGRQAVAAAPAALWTVTASDLQVGGPMTIEGNLESSQTQTINGLASFPTFDSEGEIDMGSLSLSGLLDIGGDLRSQGALDIAGDVRIPNSVTMTMGGTDAEVFGVSGTTMTFNDGDGAAYTSITGIDNYQGGTVGVNSVTVNGLYELTADSVGPYTTADPVMAMGFVSGFGSSLSTINMDPSDWYCWIGGVRMLNGDFEAGNDSADMLRVYSTENPFGGGYLANVYMNYENSEPPSIEYVYVCAQQGATEVVTTGGF